MMIPLMGMARVAALTVMQRAPTAIRAPMMAIKCRGIPTCFSKIMPRKVPTIRHRLRTVFHAGIWEKSAAFWLDAASSRSFLGASGSSL